MNRSVDDMKSTRGAFGGLTFLPAGPREDGDWNEIEETSRSSNFTMDMADPESRLCDLPPPLYLYPSKHDK